MIVVKEGFGNQSYDQIIEESNCDVSHLEITNENDIEQLVALYQINLCDQQDTIVKIDHYLNESYNKILISIYLSHVLQQDNLPEKTLQRLELFRINETNNSLPHFLLSYYYFKLNQFEKSVVYLKKANNSAQYKDYTSERKQITHKYLVSNGQNLICSYLNSMFSISNHTFFLPSMAGNEEAKQIPEYNNEVLVFAKKLEKNSTDFFSLKASFAAQARSIDKNVSPNLYESVFGKRKIALEMLDFIHNYSFKKEELLKYMKSVYEIGELETVEIYYEKSKN